MKKMMIIAVLISGMLMPAQIFAKNDRREVKKENIVSVDYNRVNKGGNVAKNHKHEPKKPAVVKHHNPAPWLCIITSLLLWWFIITSLPLWLFIITTPFL